MKAIRKAGEPKSLTKHRAGFAADFDNYQDKDGLRASLVSEQRGLCCYCLSRIRPDRSSMKIEHWHCQSRYRDEQLNYSNLLAACPGAQDHCDTRKGDRDLSRNPVNPAHVVERFIRFEGNGRIASSDPVFNIELDEVLNLSLPFLVHQRRATLDALHQSFRNSGILKRVAIERLLADWNGDSHSGDLRPYCQVVVYWLRKRLARA